MMRGRGALRRVAVVLISAVLIGGLLFAAFAGRASAQQPTSAQVSAIRQSCRSDYQRYCSSVPAGGSAALACLQQASANLSPACRQAVAAVGGSPAPAAPAAPAATPAVPAVSSPAAAATASWPHTLAYNGASVVVYQPQAISWPGKTELTARAAVSITDRKSTRLNSSH